MVCPFLDYRPLSPENGESGDETDATPAEPRAYCEAADRFVQPLRADICNDRYELAHDRDCEIYREHVDEAAHASGAGDPDADDATPAGDRTSDGDSS